MPLTTERTPMAVVSIQAALPPIVSREEWESARSRLLAQEKALMRL